MPFTEQHILITVGGDAWLGSETWQFGVRVRDARTDGGTNLADLQLLVNALAAPTQSFYSNVSMGITAAARLLWVKAAAILPTGLYPPSVQPGIYTYPSPVAGPAAGFPVPQQTLALTMYTDKPRGRASRGRFYLPPAPVSLASDGRVPASSADLMETACQTWLNAIKATAQVTEILVMSKLGTGTTGVVDRIGMGRVVDTMRSRRRSLLEARTPITL